MKEFLDFINLNWKIIVSAIGTVFLLVSSIFGFVFTRQLKKRVLLARKDHFTICPHCKAVFRLGDSDFLLPSGEVDNDLNGTPDEKEVTLEKVP